MKYLTTRQVDTCCWSEDTVRSFLTKLNRRMLLPSLSRPYISPVFSFVSMATDKIQPRRVRFEKRQITLVPVRSPCLIGLVKCIIVAHDYVVIKQPVFTGFFLPANFNLPLLFTIYQSLFCDLSLARIWFKQFHFFASYFENFNDVIFTKIPLWRSVIICIKFKRCSFGLWFSPLCIGMRFDECCRPRLRSYDLILVRSDCKYLPSPQTKKQITLCLPLITISVQILKRAARNTRKQKWFVTLLYYWSA